MKALIFVALVAAGRPPQALDADRLAAEAEVRDLERRSRALDGQTAERRAQLKKRMRALYKLSSGGYLRLLAGAESATELTARQDAVHRILERDLAELEAVREESRAVDADHARRSEKLAEALAIEQAQSLPAAEPSGLLLRMGRLDRPVPGPILSRFGAYRDPDSGLDLIRRGVEISAHRNESVRAVAPGRVRWTGEIRGLGAAVAVDHGDGYVTLLARLATLAVAVGDELPAARVVGTAAGPTLFLELTQSGTPLNPAPWLRAP